MSTLEALLNPKHHRDIIPDDEGFIDSTGIPTFSEDFLGSQFSEITKLPSQGKNGIVFSAQLGDTRVALKYLHDIDNAHTIARMLPQFQRIQAKYDNSGLAFPIGIIYEQTESKTRGTQVIPISIMEFQGDSNLDAYRIDQGGKLQGEFWKNIMTQLARSVSIMHTEEMAHRDLHPRNVRMDGNNTIIIDPDTVTVNPLATQGSRAFTEGYLVFDYLAANDAKRQDICQLGMMGFELYTGINPLQFALDEIGEHASFLTKKQALDMINERVHDSTVRMILRSCVDFENGYRDIQELRSALGDANITALARQGETSADLPSQYSLEDLAQHVHQYVGSLVPLIVDGYIKTQQLRRRNKKRTINDFDWGGKPKEFGTLMEKQIYISEEVYRAAFGDSEDMLENLADVRSIVRDTLNKWPQPVSQYNTESYEPKRAYACLDDDDKLALKKLAEWSFDYHVRAYVHGNENATNTTIGYGMQGLGTLLLPIGISVATGSIPQGMCLISAGLISFIVGRMIGKINGEFHDTMAYRELGHKPKILSLPLTDKQREQEERNRKALSAIRQYDAAKNQSIDLALARIESTKISQMETAASVVESAGLKVKKVHEVGGKLFKYNKKTGKFEPHDSRSLAQRVWEGVRYSRRPKEKKPYEKKVLDEEKAQYTITVPSFLALYDLMEAADQPITHIFCNSKFYSQDPDVPKDWVRRGKDYTGEEGAIDPILHQLRKGEKVKIKKAWAQTTMTDSERKLIFGGYAPGYLHKPMKLDVEIQKNNYHKFEYAYQALNWDSGKIELSHSDLALLAQLHDPEIFEEE